MDEGLEAASPVPVMVGTYRYSRIYSVGLMAGFIAFVWHAFDALTRGHQPVAVQDPIGFAFVALCLLSIAAYMYFYKAEIDGTRLRVGAFRRKECNLKQVIATDYTRARNGKYLNLYFLDGRKIYVPTSLEDFSNLERSIMAEIPKKPGTSQRAKLTAP